MYLVKSKVVQIHPDISGQSIQWVIDQKGYVPNSAIAKIKNDPQAWTVLSGPDPETYPIVMGTAPPNNGDGRPDGTIYIQLAT